MNEIKPEEARSLVDELGPQIKYDYTDEPIFAETRKDVCAVRRTAEDGVDYGYDTIYLVWKAGERLSHEKLISTNDSKDYVFIGGVLEEGEDLVVKVLSSGNSSGSPWNKEYRRKKLELGLEETK